MAPEAFEVERKFVYGPETEGKLLGLGASLKEQLVFHDSYFDSADYGLTLQDHWLRKRQADWELKRPVAADGKHDGSGTQYREVTREADIVAQVCQALGVQPVLGVGVDELRAALGLEAFATYVTVRKSYVLARGDVHVDLDEADFGFAVGEVEVVVKSAGEVEEALRKVNQLCAELGVVDAGRIPGKMTTYLQRFHPGHYQRLKEAQVL